MHIESLMKKAMKRSKKVVAEKQAWIHSVMVNESVDEAEAERRYVEYKKNWGK